jgi:hypothetical protein
MQIFKCPGDAILDSSMLDKPILIFVEESRQLELKPVSQEFSYDLH